MPVVQNLYQIFKIPASVLVAHKCCIKNYSIAQGTKDGNVVSIGDNLVFQQIRYLHNDYRDHRELFNYIQKIREHQRLYKKSGDFKKARILNQVIINHLFVKDVVNVCVDKQKSDFHQFRTKGFDLNGIHYVYLCSGSGQIRRNTATFINSEIHDTIVEALNCGLNHKTSEFTLAKYTAYFALSFSSILWVRTPRVCVIKDFIHILPKEKVDFICKNDEGKSVLEEREMDIELNCADGQGLIDPEFAKLWGQDMDLPFTPCSFVARSCFIKGNLVTFDFKEYARVNNISVIRDKWGKEYNIDDIDVLLSESQFKTHKYYNSWDEYFSYAEKGRIHWGVARYNKQYDDEYVLANYQYIQALTLTPQDIHELIQPTVSWIQQICSGKVLPTLLYAFGPKSEEATFNAMYGTAQTNPMKAVVKNISFLDDSYVQRKLYKSITETINRAKLGKIWVRGNYQFMIADPVAQCQSALGLEPVGLLKRDEIYSKFWLDRWREDSTPDTNCIVDACRSPMIDLHEHNPMKVVINNSEAEYWYQYLPSGIIYNTYDTSCARHSDSDYDGDIVMTTDNKYFIKGSNKSHNIITYEKGLATPAPMTLNNITKTVMKGFGSGVGGFSNTATIMYAMAAIFDKPEQQAQHDEIMTRIKLLREIVGQEIDRIKGADKPFLPSSWKKFEQVLPTDTDEEKTAKYKHNSMVVSKKPYFFRYLYPELNQRFKQFEASYNQISSDMFGIKFKKLLKLENKTDEQRNLIRKYQKYSPLITSNCNMNVLCREFESIDFDIKFAKDENDTKKKVISLLPTFESRYESTFSQEKCDFVRGLYKKYTARRQMKSVASVFDGLGSGQATEEYTELRHTVLSALITELQTELQNSPLIKSGEEFLFYCHKISKLYASFNWGFAWDILEDQIIQIIPFGKSYCAVRDDNGIDYLGAKYSLKDISSQDNLLIQKLIDALFADEHTPFQDNNDYNTEDENFLEEEDKLLYASLNNGDTTKKKTKKKED